MPTPRQQRRPDPPVRIFLTLTDPQKEGQRWFIHALVDVKKGSWPVSNDPVQFRINGTNCESPERTDNNGKASLKIFFDKPGFYRVEAIEENRHGEAYHSVSIPEPPKPAKVEVGCIRVQQKFLEKGKYLLRPIVVSTEDKPIPYLQIQMYENSKKPKVLTANGEGYAEVTISVTLAERIKTIRFIAGKAIQTVKVYLGG